jgi:hypothetical protein
MLRQHAACWCCVGGVVQTVFILRTRLPSTPHNPPMAAANQAYRMKPIVVPFLQCCAGGVVPTTSSQATWPTAGGWSQTARRRHDTWWRGWQRHWEVRVGLAYQCQVISTVCIRLPQLWVVGGAGSDSCNVRLVYCCDGWQGTNTTCGGGLALALGSGRGALAGGGGVGPSFLPPTKGDPSR